MSSKPLAGKLCGRNHEICKHTHTHTQAHADALKKQIDQHERILQMYMALHLLKPGHLNQIQNMSRHIATTKPLCGEDAISP